MLYNKHMDATDTTTTENTTDFLAELLALPEDPEQEARWAAEQEARKAARAAEVDTEGQRYAELAAARDRGYRQTGSILGAIEAMRDDSYKAVHGDYHPSRYAK